MTFLLAAQSGDVLLDWLAEAGMAGVLAFVVVAFLRGWLVSGTTYREVLAREQRALDLVYAQAEIAQRALEAAERKTG